MEALTKQQERVYKWVLAQAKQNLVPPTRAEIAAHFGWASPNAAQCHLKAIEEKGWIELVGHRRQIKFKVID